MGSGEQQFVDGSLAVTVVQCDAGFREGAIYRSAGGPGLLLLREAGKEPRRGGWGMESRYARMSVYTDGRTIRLASMQRAWPRFARKYRRKGLKTFILRRELVWPRSRKAPRSGIEAVDFGPISVLGVSSTAKGRFGRRAAPYPKSPGAPL